MGRVLAWAWAWAAAAVGRRRRAARQVEALAAPVALGAWGVRHRLGADPHLAVNPERAGKVRILAVANHWLISPCVPQ